jgi:prephenate dehydrogenase
MDEPSRVAVIGLGLMGGSLARDLAASGVTVLGYDANPIVSAAAREAGVVTEFLDASLDGVRSASTIVLATPVDVAIELLDRLSPLIGPDAVVTDVGSTKAAVGERAEALGIGDRFVGSHPLAGDHRSGWTAARASLYQGATVFLCPAASATTRSSMAVEAMWTSLGAICVTLDASEHDRRMAWISHLPQVTSSALAATLAAAGFGTDQLGPGGRDVSRLAGSSPEMWQAIAISNARPLEAAVRSLQSELHEFERALRDADRAALLQFFQRAQEWTKPAS